MPTERDAYRASEDDMSARSRRRPAAPWRKRMLSVFSMLFLVGVVVAVALVLRRANTKHDSATTNKASSDGSKATGSATGGSASNAHDDFACATRRPAAHMRTIAFWQSEVDGCEKIPLGVTHVVFGFALVDGTTGRVVPTFQNTDSEIQSCVETLRKNCIATLGGLGGSTNNDAMVNATNASAFAASAVALVDKFGFDGIDIDDETVGDAFDASRLVALVEATRIALSAKDKTLLLTYDAYFYEGQPSYCTDEAHKSYARCFPTAVLASVDWINIMAYNVARDNATAADIYENAINSTFADWKTQLGGDFTKATIGVCVGSSCAFGPGPNATVISSWNAFARTEEVGGGMMVYASSSEVADDFSVTRSVLPASS